jgi:hypothetical protein
MNYRLDLPIQPMLAFACVKGRVCANGLAKATASKEFKPSSTGIETRVLGHKEPGDEKG